MTNEQPSIHERIMGARRATGDGRDFLTSDAQPTSAKKSWLRILCYSVATVSILGVVGLGVWQFPVSAQSADQTKPKAVQQTAPRPVPIPAPTPSAGKESKAVQASTQDVDPFTASATNAGVKSCAAIYGGLGKALTEGTQFMVQNQMSKAEPDHHALQGLVGMTFAGSQDVGYRGPAAGIVFAAPVAQGCEGTMVRVVPFQQSCQDASALLPKGSQSEHVLAGLPVFALPGGGQAMLMPSGQGCIAISIVRAG